MATIKRLTFGNTPGMAYEPGGVLHGFDHDAPEVSGEAAYYSPRALALFAALGATPEDDELMLGLLSGGRWALVGCDVEGHPFAVEDAAGHYGIDGVGGYITSDLEEARREHQERGGYLLQIGDCPATYAVCSETQALSTWGRTPEQLAALADFTEA